MKREGAVIGASRLDVVTFEVVRSSLANMVHEMGIHLERAAFSPSIVEGRDFTLSLMNAQGDMIANGPEDQPAHLGTLEFTTQAVINGIDASDVDEGDFFLFNDPYSGGTHCQDMRVVHPVFIGGKLSAWLVAVGHWTDVGGPVPGTFNAMATSCYAEGIRVPPVKIVDRGVIREDVINLVLANCRLPSESRGDLHAEIGACRAGAKRFFELVDKYSAETVLATFDAMMDYSERLLLAQTSRVPDGVYEFDDYMDMDPPHPEQRPVKVHVKLEVRNGRLLFDFTGSDPAPLGSVGGSLPTTWSGVICAVLNFFPGVPFSHGALRLIEVTTTPGSCVHLLPPSPFTGMAAGALEKVISVVLNTLGQAQPEKRTAAIYNLCNMSMAGNDPRFGDRPWIMYLWLPGGFGATARGDAGLPTMMLYGPGCKNQPIEVHERIYPILYESFGMKQDSMGPGRYRGGAGIETVFYVTGAAAEFSVIGDRHKFPIWGVEGGGPGGGQDIIIRNGQADASSVGMLAIGVKMRPGERIRYFSGGGGGYGDPLDREGDLVLADVADGLLTVQAASNHYGVVVREVDPEMRSFEIDEAATVKLRAARRAAG